VFILDIFYIGFKNNSKLTENIKNVTIFIVISINNFYKDGYKTNLPAQKKEKGSSTWLYEENADSKRP